MISIKSKKWTHLFFNIFPCKLVNEEEWKKTVLESSLLNEWNEIDSHGNEVCKKCVNESVSRKAIQSIDEFEYNFIKLI